MRKNSSDQTSIHSSGYYSTKRRTSMSQTIDSRVNLQTSSLEQYSEQLANQEPLVKFRIARSTVNRNADLTKPVLKGEIKRAKEELVAIKRQLKHQRHQTESINQRKIGKLMSIIKDSFSQRNSPPPPQQIYYPVPMPMPMPLPYIMPHNNPPSNNSLKSTAFNPHYDSTNLIRTKMKDKEFKAGRARRNMSKWRKIGNAILFIAYLKQFCTLFQTGRKIMFSNFMKKSKNIANLVTKSMKVGMQPFFRVLRLNEEVNFDIEQDERRQITREKVASIRNVVRMVIQGVQRVISSNQAMIIQFCYLLCWHGSYCCTEPVLTEQQLELSCISPVFNYLSCEKNLEKAALINILFMQLLIANVFLSPFSISESTTVQNNLFYISSVLYEFLLELQDDYLLKVPKSYRIGNYGKFNFVKFKDSIRVGQSEKRAGELISGLKGQQQIKKYIPFKEWTQEKKALISIINTVWKSMKSLHQRLQSKYF